MDLYREEILEHWRNPQNFGEMGDADLIIEQVNPLCGDEVKFFFKFLNKKNPKLEARNQKQVINSKSQKKETKGELQVANCSFIGNGCAISTATSSMLSEYIKGKPVKVISKLTGKDVLEMIGGEVAPARLKCAFLPLEALRKILNSNY